MEIYPSLIKFTFLFLAPSTKAPARQQARPAVNNQMGDNQKVEDLRKQVSNLLHLHPSLLTTLQGKICPCLVLK